MRKTRLEALVALALLAMLAPSARADARPDVVEHRVTFTVANTNTSDLPCPSDGEDHEIHGLLAAPRAAFSTGVSPAVVLYLHGFTFGGKFLWSFKPVRGYDWAAGMARLGHASLSIDRLGYDESGHPDGQLTCIGSAADHTHQIVQSLRAGSYSVEGGAPVRFDDVVLVGHDTGGLVAEVEAYTYDDVDGLVVWGWAEQGSSQWVLDRFPERTAHCLLGGEPAEDADPSGASGYFHWPVSAQEIRDAVGAYMDRRVLEAAIAMRNRNPCGDLYSAFLGTELNAHSGRLGDIDVPVLLVYEDHDVIYTREGAEQQQAHYTGTDDLTWVMLEDAGHFPMLERKAGVYRQMVSNWLSDRFGRS